MSEVAHALGNLTEVITKGTTPTTLGFNFVDNGIPFIRAQNLRDGTVDPEVDPLFISESTHRALARSIITPGDVLISIAGTIGRVSVVPSTAIEMNCNQAVAIVRPKAGLHNRFLFHWLQSDDAHQQIKKSQVTGTISNLSLSQIGELKIHVPSLDTQRRIAAILDQADSLRQKRRQTLGRLDILRDAIFFDMFVRNEHGDWPTQRVADISIEVRTGPFGSQLLHSEFVEEGIAVLGIDNAVNNEFRWDERRFITAEKYRALRRYTVRPGDVLITIMGTCGRCAVVPDDIPTAINTKHLCCITLDTTKVLPRFLQASFLQHPNVLKQLGVQAKGAVMPGLNMGIIKSLELRIPPLDLQRTFVSRIEAVSEVRTRCLEHRNLLDTLFASLQHRTYRGKLTSAAVARELEMAR